ncbi:MAG: hypothetical protein A2V63_13355 [Candidatus Eisenbacteria bacterium RBG_19FT_COMBO_70_11]|nr:MAG: hypothetical protein A2V63_13355 [Candidatus Eisenbacteria bacterium RBG_19FT_COMBO_70_11]
MEKLLISFRDDRCKHDYWPKGDCYKCLENAAFDLRLAQNLQQCGFVGASAFVADHGSDTIMSAWDQLIPALQADEVDNFPGMLRWAVRQLEALP